MSYYSQAHGVPRLFSTGSAWRYLHGGITRANNPQTTKICPTIARRTGVRICLAQGQRPGRYFPGHWHHANQVQTHERMRMTVWCTCVHTDSVPWTGTSHASAQRISMLVNIKITNCVIRPWLPSWLMATGEGKECQFHEYFDAEGLSGPIRNLAISPWCPIWKIELEKNDSKANHAAFDTHTVYTRLRVTNH